MIMMNWKVLTIHDERYISSYFEYVRVHENQNFNDSENVEQGKCVF